VVVEACTKGKLTLRVTQGEQQPRRLGLEFRAYTTESGENDEKAGGLYINSAKDKDSVPVNLVISHIGIVKSKRL
jgi:hypothetical protein